ncbi:MULTISPECIES: carboxymuconolactone decarboxylase family protein [unclassified Paenibacillus]|uniref:carboxymuconolactone decarboxylase family protein n=1 Tax=unclassified Paenibacillus TaxID=185978 RepID=UPI00383365F9
MSIVPLLQVEDMSPEAKDFYEERSKNGRITNMVKTLLYSMPSFRAMEFYPVRNELQKIIGSRAIYFYCYAISTENDCLVCSTYHAKLLRDLNLTFEQFEFTEIEKILIDYGRGLVNNPNHIEDRIYEDLKRHFSNEEIVLITTVGCKMIASNIFNEAMKVDLDEYLFEVEFDKNILPTKS